MKIEIDTATLTTFELDAVVAFLLRLQGKDIAEETLETSEISDGSELKELSEVEVLYIVGVMNQYALKLPPKATFKTPELYRLATEQKWLDLSPNTRKAIGRRFKKHIDEYSTEAWEGATIVVFKGKTIQNSAIYEVGFKVEEEEV